MRAYFLPTSFPIRRRRNMQKLVREYGGDVVDLRDFVKLVRMRLNVKNPMRPIAWKPVTIFVSAGVSPHVVERVLSTKLMPLFGVRKDQYPTFQVYREGYFQRMANAGSMDVPASEFELPNVLPSLWSCGSPVREPCTDLDDGNSEYLNLA